MSGPEKKFPPRKEKAKSELKLFRSKAPRGNSSRRHLKRTWAAMFKMTMREALHMHSFAPSRMKHSMTFRNAISLGRSQGELAKSLSSRSLAISFNFLGNFPQIEMRNCPESVCRCHKQVHKTLSARFPWTSHSRLFNDSSHSDTHKRRIRGGNNTFICARVRPQKCWRAILHHSTESTKSLFTFALPFNLSSCRNHFFCLAKSLPLFNSPSAFSMTLKRKKSFRRNENVKKLKAVLLFESLNLSLKRFLFSLDYLIHYET